LTLFRGGAQRRGTPADLLVIGLGNPGKEFNGTRHNMGVEVLEELCRRTGGSLAKSKERALSAQVTLAGHQVALAFPQTFMNLSGESAVLLTKRYGITDPTHIVVVYDELDLEPGVIKVKAGGGLAGHNGLKSLKQHLHSDEFLRVRVGVGKPPGSQQGADHVLRKPGKADRQLLDVAVQLAADAVETIVADGVAVAMNRFNTRTSS
jgi:peptidyl-tRNA hydrolase, PTH1 family